MNKLLLLMLIVVTTSCSTSLKKNTYSSYEQYHQFLVSLKEKKYDDALFMLSSYNQQRFKSNKRKESFDEFFPFFSSVDSVVVKEYQHYEEDKGNKSCLTVSGYNEEGEPTSLNFELLNDNGHWKFHYIHMVYHESKSEFSSEAACPVIP